MYIDWVVGGWASPRQRAREMNFYIVLDAANEVGNAAWLAALQDKSKPRAPYSMQAWRDLAAAVCGVRRQAAEDRGQA